MREVSLEALGEDGTCPDGALNSNRAGRYGLVANGGDHGEAVHVPKPSIVDPLL